MIPCMSESKIPRIVVRENYTDLFTMAHVIGSTPQPAGDVDAIAVLPGLGEDARIIAALRAWHHAPGTRYLLVAGTNPNEKHQPQVTLDVLQSPRFCLTRTEGVVPQVHALHTREQAEWLTERTRQLGITSIKLFVSHWHLPRAYGTLIKTMDKGCLPRVPVFPVAVPTPPGAIVPETGVDVVAMSAGEAIRIQRYQATGDVATLDELREYLQWLWKQDIAPITQHVAP